MKKWWSGQYNNINTTRADFTNKGNVVILNFRLRSSKRKIYLTVTVTAKQK